MNRLRRTAVLTAALIISSPAAASAQDSEIRIRDLTTQEGALPVRLMGYGLVVGLDNTGDRAIGGQTAGQTVQSVINVLRRFNIEVPPDVIRMRNVAAVLVTAEVSPFLRPGGRFEIHVSSVGDARSLRGGVLYMTPLVADPDGPALASAQGTVLLSDGGAGLRYTPTTETTARIPQGGLLEADLPRPTTSASSRLMLREPDLVTATRIADAVNTLLGPNTATVEDEGSVLVQLADSLPAPTAFARIRELTVNPTRANRVVIDARDGTIVIGGDVMVGPAVVSHGGVTLAITSDTGAGDTAIPGSVRMPPGTSAQRIAAALHAVQTPPNEIAAIFAALRDAGAVAAEVVVR